MCVHVQKLHMHVRTHIFSELMVELFELKIAEQNQMVIYKYKIIGFLSGRMEYVWIPSYRAIVIFQNWAYWDNRRKN